MRNLHNNYREKHKIARSLLLELSTWHSALPGFSPTAQHASTDQDSSNDNSASLELGYHTIQLVIFRALLKSFGGDASTPEERQTSEWLEANNQYRTAAKTAIIAAHSFAASLGTIHFQSFWPPCKRIRVLWFLIPIANFFRGQHGIRYDVLNVHGACCHLEI